MKYGDTLTFKINTVFKSLNKEYTIRKGDIATLYDIKESLDLALL